jgi:hypothetical protein
MVLYILTFTFPDSRPEDRRLWTKWQQAFREFSQLLISLRMQFSSVSVVPSYLNFAASSKDLFAIFMLFFCPVFASSPPFVQIATATMPWSVCEMQRPSELRGTYTFLWYRGKPLHFKQTAREISLKPTTCVSTEHKTSRWLIWRVYYCHTANVSLRP